MKATFLLILACIAGCNKQPNTEINENMQQSQILRINNQGDIASLHPHTGIDLMCRIYQKALFEGLTRVNADNVPELTGALSVDISPAQTTYTFKLRPMVWNNGEPVTAYHYEKAWKKAIAPNSNCMRTDLFYPIKNAKRVQQQQLPLDAIGVSAQDEKTLIVELEHPAPYFLELMANPLFFPLYDDADMPLVFNGPFQLASWEHDVLLKLEKNPYYWDEETVQLESIEVSLVADPNTALMMYEKGELDYVGFPFTTLHYDVIPGLEQRPDYATQPIAGVFWICLNTQQFPLNSIKLRRALSTAIDRKTITKHTLPGETPTKSLIPPSMALLQETELFADGNRKKAQALFNEALEELHLTKEEFPTLKLSYGDVPGQKKLAETLQENWEQTFGVKFELIQSQWNVFFASLGEKQYQIGGLIWFSVFNDPMYNLEFFKQRDTRYNAPGWENMHYQKLLDLADQEKDPFIRREHLKQAEQLILDEMPIIPLFVFHSKYLKTQRVKELFVSNLGEADFKWAYVEESCVAMSSR